ncbi:MAG: radical SAM family heme chaperone HemW [Actinomycetota bacterium]|nr:radical SAM family heme chaperone HemW [Actinomycetota bacterium]
MPSTFPPGQAAPADGRIGAAALATLPEHPLAFYVHVPFCATRCGYCDFNTYTATELGEHPGASRATYADGVMRELDLATRVLGEAADRPPVSTVFFGGGTPTLLDPAHLTGIVAAIDERFGLAEHAEVTTEANPDSVDLDALRRLRDGGINRISFGMQSAVPRVLATLDRTHDPERLPDVVAWARAAGFDQISLDLIYGTPGESEQDWRRSVESVVALRPDHVSAYALIVEPGTALARQVDRGDVPEPDDDDLADKYVLADEMLGAAGLGWYELSNWSRDRAARCRHNETYWTSGNWWGLGPGAHSHVGGVRWWNVKHPTAYAGRLAEDVSPAHAREVLDEPTRRVERVLLESRLRDGLDVTLLDDEGRRRLARLVAEGLVDPGELPSGRLVLTRRGRLLADAVVRDLLP